MQIVQDAVLSSLDEIVDTDVVSVVVDEVLTRVLQQLASSNELMAWEVVPLEIFKHGLPESIRSCWIFAIRAGAATGAERHPNSHQRSFSLIGDGTFEVREGGNWRPHPLTSTGQGNMEQRWVSIPPATWHRLIVGSNAWGMLSFHTVAPNELIEETPLNTNDLEGATHQERYAGRR